ncbi:MAG: ribosome maturation factor RimP [Clostridiales Family XIII bacterium]|jgi:ribosome maturation factor RimP|nr:ribosome maturation factor RimP [Clostridiales Family XIII bacterium]
MSKKKVVAVVEEALAEFLPANGYELYNVEFVKEGKDWFLRAYIDIAEGEAGTRGGVSLDDCEKVSRFLSDALDRLDPVERNYYLEVSSPGLDRELIRDRDFARFVGSPVRVKLYQPYEGSKSLSGTLLGLEGGEVAIRLGDERVALPRDKVAQVRLEVVV